jgi:diacylglycerol kinase family enzyme
MVLYFLTILTNLATERAGHATEIAQKLDVTKWDIVVSVGGDGTLSGGPSNLMF